jgi:hypothetical protein
MAHLNELAVRLQKPAWCIPPFPQRSKTHTPIPPQNHAVELVLCPYHLTNHWILVCFQLREDYVLMSVLDTLNRDDLTRLASGFRDELVDQLSWVSRRRVREGDIRIDVADCPVVQQDAWRCGPLVCWMAERSLLGHALPEAPEQVPLKDMREELRRFVNVEDSDKTESESEEELVAFTYDDQGQVVTEFDMEPIRHPHAHMHSSFADAHIST